MRTSLASLASLSRILLALPALPFVMGAQGDGCAAASTSPAPDVRGTWAVDYDDTIGVEVKIGGAVYTAELGAAGGSVTITHAGTPYTFDLDCARADIVCPSEAWPSRVVIEQRDVDHQHQMIVNLPAAECAGALTKPAPGSCGAGTSNPNCDLVCDGDVTVQTAEAFGVIGERGDTFRLFLGGGIVTNGINCAMLGYSVADADLVTTGDAGADWEATQMQAGLVTIGYGGACLFAGTIDGQNEALLVGAEVKFTTGFTGAKL
ncbi:MAG TPA: hypothetical protein VFQ53_13660 [Kofleriaceae bacterium]|nr:hypothetical protein [Kofleriaceae bacterium]